MEKRTTICRWVLGACLCVVTVASVRPQLGKADDSSVEIFSVGLDKFQHFFAFALIMVLAIGVFRKPTTRRVATAAIWVMLFGIAIEGVQFLLPFRTFNPLDIASNSAGILASIMLWWHFKKNEGGKCDETVLTR